jgi:hypothetical protein
MLLSSKPFQSPTSEWLRKARRPNGQNRHLNATFQYNIEDEKLANGRFLDKRLLKDIEFGFQTTFRMYKSQSLAPIVLVKSAASGCDLDLVHVEDEISNRIELVDEFDCFAVPPSGLVHEPPESFLVRCRLRVGSLRLSSPSP